MPTIECVTYSSETQDCFTDCSPADCNPITDCNPDNECNPDNSCKPNK